MSLARWMKWLPIGRLSGRKAKAMPGFDRDYYLEHNADIRDADLDPLEHYLEFGWREGREPSAGFNGQRYLALNPDVQAEGINPLVHYLKHGLVEGRRGAHVEPVAPSASIMPPEASTPSPATDSGTLPRHDPPLQETRLL